MACRSCWLPFGSETAWMTWWGISRVFWNSWQNLLWNNRWCKAPVPCRKSIDFLGLKKNSQCLNRKLLLKNQYEKIILKKWNIYLCRDLRFFEATAASAFSRRSCMRSRARLSSWISLSFDAVVWGNALLMAPFLSLWVLHKCRYPGYLYRNFLQNPWPDEWQ